MTDNGGSPGVSHRRGYLPDGLMRQSVRGKARALTPLRPDRAGWEAHRTVPVDVHGLEPCLPLFGL
jgi:hypothetical protein